MKVWVDANKVFETNTNAEICNELYGDGMTAKYTKHIKELDVILQAEKEAKAKKEQSKKSRD